MRTRNSEFRKPAKIGLFSFIFKEKHKIHQALTARKYFGQCWHIRQVRAQPGKSFLPKTKIILQNMKALSQSLDKKVADTGRNEFCSRGTSC